MSARHEGFGSSLVFAALAAGAWPAVAVVLGPALGLRSALVLHILVSGGVWLLRYGPARLRAAERKPLRGVVRELAIALAAYGLARAAFAPTLAGTALAIWAFGLVESAGCLLAGAAGADDTDRPDPFEEAMRRARAALEDR
ncbi:MAG TPA: hypothetical protein VNE71_13420 [Myxococcota bacterium]|nr:hypothetical protein [Myxococcota bacterium]